MLDPDALIWATRGKSWGFRFLRDGGLSDPLPTYEEAFASIGSDPLVYRRVGRSVVLRFPDPEGRTDAAGRVIPHDFVVFPPVASEINSVDEGMALVWAAVADEFARVWASNSPPRSRR
jgi:hypothetical protein